MIEHTRVSPSLTPSQRPLTAAVPGSHAAHAAPAGGEVFTPSSLEHTLEKVPEYARPYFSTGNQVTPLFDPTTSRAQQGEEIFAHIRSALQEAKSSIQIEMFSLDKKDLVDLLCARAKEGVKVQIVMDPPNDANEADKAKAIETLRQAGAEVHLYPVAEAGSKEARFGQIDHVKMLVTDSSRAIIGGMNWGEHSPSNHDFDVDVRGPAVGRMGSIFREDWIRSGGDASVLPKPVKVAPQGESLVNLVVSSLDKNEQTIGKTVDRAIDNARSSVHAELFVLSDTPTISSLIHAKERGVDVKVILNPLKIHDNPVNEKGAQRLAEAGVDVRWYVCDEATQQKMHAKMAVFDDDQTILGSANWSYAGFHTNREADVEILDPKVNQSIQRVFEDDWKNHTSATPIYLASPDENAGG